MTSANNGRIKKFDGSERHDWPDFAKNMIAYGGLKGGWDDYPDAKEELDPSLPTPMELSYRETAGYER